MKAVMISIQPKWVEKIANGEKTIEVRKTAPKEVPFKCYIYETKGQYVKFTHGAHTKYGYGRGKVIGEFICDNVYSIKNRGSSFSVADEEQSVTNEIARQSCLYYDDMVSYFGNKDGFGWHISDLKIYDKPRELSEFNAVCKYINEDKSCHFRKVMCPYQQFDYNEDGSINIVECSRVIIRPPQSWQYIEDLGEEK